jgi:flagellar biosynthesis protein FlhG
MKDLAQYQINKIIPLPRVHRGQGMRIISVTGGKGGVGKSCISVNLALGLQKLGGRILLLDGDLGLANADQLLGVHAPSTLLDVIQGRIKLEEAVVDTAYGVSLLPACSGRQEMAELDGETRSALLNSVKALDGEYDFVVVDTAAGIGETALGLAGAGNQILAVATPDPTSARDVFAVMKILSKDYGVRYMSLVPNMISSPAEGMALYHKISRVAGRFLPLTLNLGGIVMRDPSLAKSVRNRTPMMASYPASVASKQISEMAVRLVTRDREMHFFEDDELEDLS